MATGLFGEVRNRQLATQLRATMDTQYTVNALRRVGVVLNTGQIMVGSQRYPLRGAAGFPIGTKIAVHNIARTGDALYIPEYASKQKYPIPEELTTDVIATTPATTTKHQVHFSLMLPALIVPPGPTNITGSALTISAVLISSDDSTVAGSLSVSGHSYAFSPSHDTSGLSDIWSTGDTMTLTLTDPGSDGTYLSIDVAAG